MVEFKSESLDEFIGTGGRIKSESVVAFRRIMQGELFGLYPNQDSVATNGKLYIIAIIGFFIKVKRNLLLFEYIKNPETWELELQKDNISGKIFSDYRENDFNDLIYGLFSDLIQEVANAYELKQHLKKTVTNYLKHDSDYRNDILKHIISRYYQNPKRLSELNEYLKIFN